MLITIVIIIMSSKLSALSTSPCVCIPYARNTEWLFVKSSFEKAFGEQCIKRVDIVNKRNKNNQLYNCIFVHFNSWPENTIAQNTRDKLLSGESVKLIYDFPWYWKCYASKNKRG